MRIIAGRHKGRSLRSPRDQLIRPTADRARQALFNILDHGDLPVDGTRFLDVFAGTGAIGLEALSRGATFTTFIENDRTAARLIETNLAALGERDTARVLTADATTLRPSTTQPHDIAFLDPPYGSTLANPALDRLLKGQWLAPHARIIVELAASEPFTPPAGLEPEQERRIGAARFVFLRIGATEN